MNTRRKRRVRHIEPDGSGRAKAARGGGGGRVMKRGVVRGPTQPTHTAALPDPDAHAAGGGGDPLMSDTDFSSGLVLLTYTAAFAEPAGSPGSVKSGTTGSGGSTRPTHFDVPAGGGGGGGGGGSGGGDSSDGIESDSNDGSDTSDGEEDDPEVRVGGESKPNSERRLDSGLDYSSGRVCRVCDKEFMTKSGLIAHVYATHEGRRSECPICKKQLTSKGNLKKHLETVHLKLHLKKCDICEKIFSSKSHLKTHVRMVHEGRRDFKCTLCDSAFGRRAHLQTHVLAVHKKVKVRCDECGDKFHPVYLPTHKRVVHGGEKKHKCPECGRAFAKCANMMRHAQTVHQGQKPPEAKCKECGKQLVSVAKLRRHVRTQHLNPPESHECGVCGHVLATRRGLVRHKARVHEG